ncbi:MAG: FAD-dependent oxidoreductase [Candidatus Diapherotrites archaeon]|nr:FAD-dependent oxidoreductase [Candidatus Diapherotrites archaeon]
MSEVLDLVIIGTGPAGLSAAIYAGVYKLNFKVVGKDYGLLAGAHEIWNYPGVKAIAGFELVQRMRDHAVDSFKAEIIDDEVIAVRKSGEHFSVQLKSAETLECKALIIATGLMNRKLGIGEERLIGKGVSYCATCDAGLFSGKTVGVIGGSDSTASAALLLAEYAKKVLIFYRQDALRCQPVYLPKLQEKKNIEIVCNSTVVQVVGDKMLEKIVLECDGKKTELKLDGLFPEIGAVPQNVLLDKLGVKFDASGFIPVDLNQKTSTEGVYAAGDITSSHPKFKQVVVAAGEGAVASNSVYRFLKESNKI